MKFAVLHKQNTASTSAATIALGAVAGTGFRTLAQAIAEGELAVGDQTTFMVRDTAGKFEFSLFTVTNSTTLTRVAVRRSSNGGAAETFGSGVTVSNMPDSDWLSQLYGASDALDVTSLQSLTSMADTDAVLVLRNNALYIAMGPVLKAYAGGTTAPVATVSSVTVSPSAPSVSGGASQTFTASVTGTNSPAQTVTWTAGAGTITSGGVFTAPAATASAQTITITARSTVDTTKTGTATVTVPATGTPTPTVSSVTVSPSAPSVNGGATQQFTAAVTGTNSPSQGVNWTASAGTITSGGLFTAPAAISSAQTITVTATSQLDGTKSGTSTVTVPAAAPTVAYTVSGYAGNTLKTTLNVSGKQIYNGKRQVLATDTGTSSSYAIYWDVKTNPGGVLAPGCRAGWSTSSTVPPDASITTYLANGTNDGANPVIGVYVNMPKNVTFDIYPLTLWVPTGTPDGTQYHLWFYPSDGVPILVGSMAVTGA